MNAPQHRLRSLVKQLQDKSASLSWALHSGVEERRKGALDALAALEQAVDAYLQVISPENTSILPSAADRIASLVDALERIARSRRPSLLPMDSIKGLVVEHSTDEFQEHWRGVPETTVFGHVAFSEELTDELRKRGILVWAGSRDKFVRVVNTNWLQTSYEIFSFVHGDKPGGNACRFCAITEPNGSEELEPDGQTDRIHPRCRDHWRRWEAIAAEVAMPVTVNG